MKARVYTVAGVAIAAATAVGGLVATGVWRAAEALRLLDRPAR